MIVRFIEFVRGDNKEIALYFIQQQDEGHDECFDVKMICDQVTIHFSCRKCHDTWDIVTPDIPSWVRELKPSIAMIIEKRMSA